MATTKYVAPATDYRRPAAALMSHYPTSTYNL